MRYGYLVLFILFQAILSVFSGPAASAEDVQKAKTLDELAKMYDVSSCKECHSEIYDQWEKSLHARSILGTPRTSDAFGRMVKSYIVDGQWKYTGVKKLEDLKVEDVMVCLECHLPQIKDATDEVAQELAQAAINGDHAMLQKVNINCIVCHNKKALIHEWVDGPPEKGVMYGSKDGEHTGSEMFPVLKKSPTISETIFCGQCHGTGPMFHYPMPVHCATAYGSYMHAYLPSGGMKSCQECHMESGHQMPAYRDPETAKKAVKVEVDAMGYYFHPKANEWVPEAVVTVKMESQAGHRIPDG
jgi:nitrate/TMAO reductase-like tetraheme cytochrome c subunit